MIYVEKGNVGYKIDDKDLGEYKARKFTVPGEKQEAPSASEGTSESQDPSADDKKKSGQK